VRLSSKNDPEYKNLLPSIQIYGLWEARLGKATSVSLGAAPAACMHITSACEPRLSFQPETHPTVSPHDAVGMIELVTPFCCTRTVLLSTELSRFSWKRKRGRSSTGSASPLQSSSEGDKRTPGSSFVLL
jgi:hypothetical protein